MSTSSFARHGRSESTGLLSRDAFDRRPARREFTVKELISLTAFDAVVFAESGFEWVRRRFARMARRRAEERTLRILLELDPQSLKDVGLTRDQLTRERLPDLLARRDGLWGR